MKTHTALSILAGLLFTAATSLEAYPLGTPIIAPVTQVRLNGMPSVEVGTQQSVALKRLGRPAQQLTDNTWVFDGHRPSNEHLVDHECNQLMVTFENGRVVRIAVANPKAIRILVATPDADPRFTKSRAYAASAKR